MADLRSKLKSILANLKSDCQSEFTRCLAEFGDELRSVCRGKPGPSVAEQFGILAETLDAIDYIESHWDAKETEDIKVPQSNVEDMRAYFREIFESGELSQRGFVYVAWTQKPEDFHYVGKTLDPKRVIQQHIKLAASLQNVTSLSLLYPYKSTNDCLLDLEASVITVLLFAGKHPQNNGQLPTVPLGKGSALLRNVMMDISKRIKIILDETD